MELDNHFWTALFHVLVVTSLFLYVGFTRADTPSFVYTSLFAIGCVILVYHGYKLFLRLTNKSSSAWVNAIHIILIAPLLLYIGYHKKNTPRTAYELMLLLGFSAGGYHLFSMVKQLNTYHD
jgi:hypothetical protein